MEEKSEPMKPLLTTLMAASLLTATGCAELKEIVDEYKAEKSAKEAEQNRIQMLDIDQPIAKLSVKAIAKEFDDNSVMAENKYMNQPVELTGYIGSIDDSMFDEKNVSITITGGEYSFSSVSCTKPRNSPEVSELRKGMRVAVRGVVTSEEMGIDLSRCKFWSFSQDRWIGNNPTNTNLQPTQQKASQGSRSNAAEMANTTGLTAANCQFIDGSNSQEMRCQLAQTPTSFSIIWSDGLVEKYKKLSENSFKDDIGDTLKVSRATDGKITALSYDNGNRVTIRY